MITQKHIPKYPKQLHIEITTHCNLSCYFCPHDKINRPKIMNENLLLSIMKQIVDWNLEYLDFVNYGETLLHPDWFYIHKLAHDMLFANKEAGLGLVSNGTIMNLEIAQQLESIPFRQVIFSVDGFSKEVFESIRGPNTRDRVYENVCFYCDYFSSEHNKRPPIIAMTVCEKNESDIQNFLNFWSKKNAYPKVYVATGRGGREKPYSKPNNNPCSVILDGMWILSDGKVVPCCEDWSGIEIMGDANYQSLEEIWSSDKWIDFRYKHLLGKKSEITLCSACQTSQDSINHNVYLARS